MIYRKEGVTAQTKAFHDMWTLTQQNNQLLLQFENTIDSLDDVSSVVKDFLKAWIAPLKQGAGSKDKKMLVYLLYMTERLVLMKKILKDTGSIYLHCDSTASHYLKVIMDGIFNSENFRNEIIWRRDFAKNWKNPRQFGRCTDTILFYTKNHKLHYFNIDRAKIQLTKEELLKKYPLEDEYGMYYKRSIENARGSDPRPNLCYKYKGYFPKYAGGWRFSKESLRKLDEAGDLGWNENGTPYRKQRMTDDRGETLDNLWTDVNRLSSTNKESFGYDTQKPLALLDRIIKASCPAGGGSNKPIVLDPFCGCGTTIEAAIKNNVDWIGIDISWDAIEITKERIKKANEFLEYKFLDGNPQTREEYEKLNPYQKQDWLVKRCKGFPNPKKSGDGGIDGEVGIYLGKNDKGVDVWGKVIFSVKTGKQCNPAMIRELKGTMGDFKADIGVLILDKDPSLEMDIQAQNQGQIKYSVSKDIPPRFIDKVQIITSQEIIDNCTPDLPPTVTDMKLHQINTGRQMQAF